jgi:uncharacterized protein YuzE
MMESTYDADADALYLKFTKAAIARTRCVDDGTMVDEDAEGHVVGIEVLRPARDWPLGVILADYEFAPSDRELLTSMFGTGRTLRTVPPSHDAIGMAQLVHTC